MDSSVILNLIGLVNTRGGPLKDKPCINLFLLKDKQESREVNINCFWTHHTGQALKDNPIFHLDCHLSHYGGHHPINLPLLTSLRPAFPPEGKGWECNSCFWRTVYCFHEWTYWINKNYLLLVLCAWMDLMNRYLIPGTCYFNVTGTLCMNGIIHEKLPDTWYLLLQCYRFFVHEWTYWISTWPVSEAAPPSWKGLTRGGTQSKSPGDQIP